MNERIEPGLAYGMNLYPGLGMASGMPSGRGQPPIVRKKNPYGKLLLIGGGVAAGAILLFILLNR